MKNLAEFPNVRAFLGTFEKLISVAVTVGGVIFISEMTAFPSLKNSSNYSSHQYQYQWLVSASYMIGYVPVILISTLWTGAVISYFLVISRNNIDQWSLFEKNKFKKRNENAYSKGALLIFSFAFEAAIAALLNVAYVLIIANCPRNLFFLVQLAFSVIKLLMNIIFVPMYANRIANLGTLNRLERVMLRSSMLIFNIIYAPILSIILSDGACFKDLLTGVQDISTHYQVQSCEVLDPITQQCTSSVTLDVVTSFLPPFIYNYQCRNAFLNAYVPVLIYTYISIAFLIPLASVFLARCKIENVPKVLLQSYGAIIWPNEIFTKDLFRFVIDAEEIMTTQNLHISVMLTFGLLSPPLLISVIVAMCTDFLLWRILIGRYLLINVDTLSRATLEIECLSAWRCPNNSMWPTILSSSIFLGLILTDMAADEVLSISIISISIYFVSLPILLWVLRKIYKVVIVKKNVAVVTGFTPTPYDSGEQKQIGDDDRNEYYGAARAEKLSVDVKVSVEEVNTSLDSIDICVCTSKNTISPFHVETSLS